MSGTELFDRLRRGEIAAPPFARLLGIELFAGAGTMALPPQEIHYNPTGCVQGGKRAALVDSVMSAAVHAAFPPGKGHLTLASVSPFRNRGSGRRARLWRREA